MGFEILDGTGKGFIARVDADNRLHVDAISQDEYAYASSEYGDAYTINSGYVTLTGSNTTNGVLFVKNDGDNPIVIQRFNLSCKASTGTTETHGRYIFYRNPGSMIAGSGVSITPQNLNFGSSNTLDVTAQRGQNITRFAVTSSVFGSPVAPLQNLTLIDSVAVIPKGSSLGVSFVTPVSNTSVQVAVGVNVYVQRTE